MKRRSFLTWMGLGWLASVLPVAIAACTSQFKRLESRPRPDGFQAIGTVAELEQFPGTIQVQVDSTPVIAIRHPLQPGALVALNPTCPHAGCKVDWQKDNSKFVCPCHGSKFDPSGKVIRGPAARNLTGYPAKAEDQSILVKLG
jgi:cytochrome b6-f complex iron-sulfur subunit